MTTDVESFFDPKTFTLTHIVTDPETRSCAVIDPVLDFDVASARTGHAGIDAVIKRIAERGLSVQWILETHVHADHLTAAPYLRDAVGGRTGIGSEVGRVQKTFKRIFNIGGELRPDGSAFDRLFADGETLEIGGLTGRVLHTPGHTPACATYVFGDAAFVGDTLFAPDYGTARCDFPGGDARTLYASIARILALPDATRLFHCHDYLPGGRPLVVSTTVAEQRAENVHLVGKDADAFAAMRAERDAGLSMPALIIPSVQVNIRAGRFPAAEDDGAVYLKWPIDKF